LRRVGRDASVDVSEPVEAAHGREATVDRRRGQAAHFHGGAVQLDVWPRRVQHDQLPVGRPLKERPQVISIGVQGSAAVPSEKRDRCQLRLIKHLIGCPPQRGRGLFPDRHLLHLH